MSKYTTEVRFICERYAELEESVGYAQSSMVIEKSRSKVFDFDYPIFDETYRSVLETKILRHYYTREIGVETVGLWKFMLCTKLNEIMPYYNKLYKSELLDFNPMYDVDITRTHNLQKDGVRIDDGETKTDNNSKNKTFFHDTPQGNVNSIEEGNYLTSATVDNFEGDGTVTTNGESVITDTEEYLETVKGKNGGSSYAKMLKDYRATFLNIDMEIINELSDLFMNLW